MIDALRHLARALSMLRCLGRNGAFSLALAQPLPPLAHRVLTLLNNPNAPGRPGQRLAKALVELGPTFIKFGQSLATRPDLIGEEAAEDLSGLQDNLEAFPGAEARAMIEADLERPVDRLFAVFEDTSTAAASIAQVHKAITTDGRTVAVKVLRPGIEQRLEADLRFFMTMADWAERFVPLAARFKAREVVQVFVRTTRREVDLRMEAAAADEFRVNNIDAEGFRVPAVDWERTGKRVMTLEWVTGLASDERDAMIEAGIDPTLVLERASQVFFQQVFVHGFFHGDMHPGNTFIEADGTIVAVDFGIMGRLALVDRLFLGELLLSFLLRDYPRLVSVLVRAGIVGPDEDQGALAQAVRSIAEPIMGLPLNQISFGRLLGQLFEVLGEFDVRVQTQLLLLQKTMVVAEGIGRALNPDVNMWILAQPLVEDWIVDNLGPVAQVQRGVTATGDVLNRLPSIVQRADELLGDLEARRERGAARQWRLPGALWWLSLGVGLGWLLF